MTSPTLIFSALSMLIEREDVHGLHEIVAEGVLEGGLLDALEAIGVVRSILDDLFVLDVTDLDLADALGQPEYLQLGERLDGVRDFAVLVHDGGVVALLDGRPDAEAEADALGAGISRLLPSRMPISSISSKRWSAA